LSYLKTWRAPRTLEVSVEQIASPRLRDPEDVDERRPTELVIAGNIQQEVKKLPADAHVFQLRPAESRVPPFHRPTLRW
jgi:hypothetical protein